MSQKSLDLIELTSEKGGLKGERGQAGSGIYEDEKTSGHF